MTRTPTNALRSAFRAAIDQADPEAAVARHMTALSRNANGRVIVIAAGKAAPAIHLPFQDLGLVIEWSHHLTL